MEAFLGAWLRRVLPKECTFEIHPHRGKTALLRKLESRLKGYAEWMTPGHRLVVVVDRDGDSCTDLKDKLEQACQKAGLRSKRASCGQDWQVVTRIAIEELEAWYFGDWQAVRAAYPRVSANVPRKAAYRIPDEISGGTCEAFERVMRTHGYFRQGLAKVQAATAIGGNFDPARASSQSFNQFWDALKQACGGT